MADPDDAPQAPDAPPDATGEPETPAGADELTLLQVGDLIDDRPDHRPRAPTTRRSAPSRASADAPLLRTLLMPRIASLSHRLSAARHQTTVDDRLSQQPPSVRFRVEPWRGPFDDEIARGGAVLEVVLDGGPDGSVAAHFWLDPLSAGPSERRGVPAAELTGAWLDAVMLDFVRKALR